VNTIGAGDLTPLSVQLLSAYVAYATDVPMTCWRSGMPDAVLLGPGRYLYDAEAGVTITGAGDLTPLFMHECWCAANGANAATMHARMLP
jgi:hypothetical protein